MKTVLIVEDEKMIRQGIKTMIMRSGLIKQLEMKIKS
jgi:two-component system response regulator YesN